MCFNDTFCFSVGNFLIWRLYIPAYKPGQVVDATGCGDTYTIGYLYQRVSGASIEEAGRFAAAMSTLKIEKSGPFCGNKEDVIRCMETAEQMY